MILQPDVIVSALAGEWFSAFLQILTALGVGAFGVWTTPRTWVAGEVVTASIMNVHVRDNLADLNTRMDLAPQFSQDTETILANKTLLNTNDASVLLLDPDANRTLYGCEVPPRSPWLLYIVNIDSFDVTLNHEDTVNEATPARRFYLPASGSIVLSLGEGIALLHLSVPAGSRWVSIIGQ